MLPGENPRIAATTFDDWPGAAATVPRSQSMNEEPWDDPIRRYSAFKPPRRIA